MHTKIRSAPDQNEKTLIEQCLKGRLSAQRKLYNKYYQAMFNNILRIVGNVNDAEDALQETFLKVFRKLDTFNGDSTLGAWIKRIAINQALNVIRSRKPPWQELEDSTSTISIPPASEKENLEPSIAKVHHAIKTLPEGCRVVFTLYLLEGYQHQEISDILNISISTSKSQYQRAKRLLQQELKQQLCYD